MATLMREKTQKELSEKHAAAARAARLARLFEDDDDDQEDKKDSSEVGANLNGFMSKVNNHLQVEMKLMSAWRAKDEAEATNTAK